MKTLKLLRIICSCVAIASMLIWLARYTESPTTFVPSKYEYLYYYGIICAGLLSAIFEVIYLILAKNYKGLRRFFINVIVIIVLYFVFAYLLV